ncbi:Multidrug and toxin extrusion protein 2 [Phytophthora ramorum]|uniref:Multidrug and toxin extrusion protein 2 n=1 Tax=Phytophthora ramorum TaxID=164328 RepID=UPI0030A23EEE|nr:Multidrug and toxin extrusion protein 2 [Phytophthora ramorum]
MDERLTDKRSSGLHESFVTIEQSDTNQHDEPDPRPVEELRNLFKLVLPVTGTTVLEFLPGFVSILLAALVFSLSDHIPLLFLSDQESIDLASKIMALWSPLEIADGLNAVMQGIFRGAGKQRPAAIANVVGYYGGGISLASILAFACDQGVEGLWLGIGFGIVATLAAMTFLMLRYWKWDELARDAKERTAY